MITGEAKKVYQREYMRGYMRNLRKNKVLSKTPIIEQINNVQDAAGLTNSVKTSPNTPLLRPIKTVTNTLRPIGHTEGCQCLYCRSMG